MTENIPREVVEYFDEIYQSNIDERPYFLCLKCGVTMRFKEYDVVCGKSCNVYNKKTIEKK